MEKPATEDAISAAVRYIEIVLKEETLTKLSRQYLENAKVLIRGGKI